MNHEHPFYIDVNFTPKRYRYYIVEHDTLRGKAEVMCELTTVSDEIRGKIRPDWD